MFEVEAVRVQYPNGGEQLAVGDTCWIAWETFSPPRCDSVSLFLRTDTVVEPGRAFWRLDTIVTGFSPEDSVYGWVVPDTLVESAWVMAIAYGPGWQFDVSDGSFSIVASALGDGEQAAWRRWNPPTVLRGAIRVPEGVSAILLDPTGRRVAEFEPGLCDLRALSPGVYFLQSQIGNRQSSMVRKVVLTR